MFRAVGCTSVLFALFLAGAQSASADSVLSLTATGVGARVQLSPPGSYAGCNQVTCFYRFPTGTPVTLTAITSSPGSSLAGWLGACTGLAPTCTLRLDTNKSVGARFSPVRLYADEQGGFGQVSVSPVGQPCPNENGCWSYPYATVVTVFAQADAGYAFGRWSGFCATQSSSVCGFTMFTNVETSPVFVCAGDVCATRQPITQEVRTTVAVVGRGYVRVNGSTCRSTCRYTFNRGKPVALRAYTQNSRFVRWNGSCIGSRRQCQFSAFKDAYGRPPSVKANFR